MTASQAAPAVAERVDFTAFGFAPDFDPFAERYYVEFPPESDTFAPNEESLEAIEKMAEILAEHEAAQADQEHYREAVADAARAEKRRFAKKLNVDPEKFVEDYNAIEDDTSAFDALYGDFMAERFCRHMERWYERQAKLKAHKSEPKAPPKQLDFTERYVYVKDADGYYDLMSGKWLKTKAVHMLIKPHIGDASPPIYMVKYGNVVDRVSYNADKPRCYKDSKGLWCLNTYQHSELVPLVGSAKPWLDHVDNFFGDDVASREHFKDWLAFKCQHPMRKVRHGVILHSVQGTGKGMMAQPLFDVWGENIIAPDNGELTQGRMTFLERKLMVVVHELKAHDNKFVADRLKPVISETVTRIDPKFINPYTIENPASVLCFTNWEAALFLEDSDRRWFVFSSPMKPQPPEYYKALAKWYEDGGAAYVFRYLLDRDVSDFNPDQHPPVTAAKRQTIEASRGETRNRLQELWEDRKAPFNLALLNLKDAVEYLKQRGVEKLTTTALQRFLREKGAGPVSTSGGTMQAVRYRKGGKSYRERLWCLQGDPAAWVGRDYDEIGENVWQWALTEEADD